MLDRIDTTETMIPLKALVQSIYYMRYTHGRKYVSVCQFG